MGDLPRYTESQRQGDEGVRQLGLVVGRGLGWVVREQATGDFGIDAHIEIIERGLATGRLLGVQVKSGASLFDEPVPGGWRFRGDPKHRAYWSEHSLPVLVVLCRPDDVCFWAHVTSSAIQTHDQSWTITVPEENRFDEDSRARLHDLASRKSDVPLEHLLRSFLSDKYGARIVVASIIEIPRDWHYFHELVELDEELFAVHLIEADERSLDRALLDDIRKWRAYNERSACGLAGVMLHVAARTPDGLPSPDVLRGLEEEEPGLRITRLLVGDFDLEEIDDDGNALMWFASTGESMPSHRVIP
jgi:hypothetical protein